MMLPPRCPDCGELGRHIRGDYLSCSCGSVWEVLEYGLSAEEKMKKEKERLEVFLKDVRDGDYIIHPDCGTGIFRGTAVLDAGTQPGSDTQPYLVLEYAGGDKLYFPVSRVHLLRKHVSAIPPVVRKLGALGQVPAATTTPVKSRRGRPARSKR